MKFKLVPIVQAAALALLSVFGAFAATHNPPACAKTQVETVCEL